LTTIEDLQRQLDERTAQLLTVRLELIDTKICELQDNDADKEKRLRTVESSATRFEFLVWLAVAGGIASLISMITRGL
jgi:hypothetical protein